MFDPRRVRAEQDFVAGVREAAAALSALFEPTPLQRNDFLSERFGGEVWLKREDLAPVRSYKIRGAFNAMRKALDARARTGAGSSAPRPATTRRGSPTPAATSAPTAWCSCR